MKTTIELPDALFAAAKAKAAERRTTLKAMVEHALRREIAFDCAKTSEMPIEVNALGIPVLKRSRGVPVESEDVYRLIDEEPL